MTPVVAAEPRPSTRRAWRWIRGGGAVAILALLGWQVGTGPFVAGVRAVDRTAVITAVAIGVVTTVACAWRWSLVAAGLGVRLPLPGAVAAYYGSQFLNTTLPSGVMGDVHRAVRHGVDIGDVGLGVRAAVLDRVAGQVVQAGIAVVVLVAFPTPLKAHLPAIVATLITGGVLVTLMVLALARDPADRWIGWLRTVGFSRRTWVSIGLASTVVVVGHLSTFVLAARTAGSTAPLTMLVPLTLLALIAMALPLNIAGWGPREGVAAWAFGAAGLTAAEGVATAVTYGVLVFLASLPGVVVLLWRQGSNRG